MKKLVLVLTLILVLTFSFSSYGADEFTPSDYPLGMVGVLKGHPVVMIMESGFLHGAKELGYSAELLMAQKSDYSEAITLGEAGISKGIKGMIVQVHDPAYYSFVKRADEAGIPVISAHFPQEKGACPGLDAWVSADPYEYGYNAALAIGKEVGGQGTVAVTQGSFNVTENAAAKGFTEGMNENYPDIKVLEPIEEGFDPAVAISRATAIIQRNSDLVGAFSTTGGGPTTWAGAQDETGKKIAAIGMDYSEVNLDLLKEGKIFGIVAQPLFKEHDVAVELLDKLLRGEEVPYENILEAPIVTKDDTELIKNYEGIHKLVEEAFSGM